MLLGFLAEFGFSSTAALDLRKLLVPGHALSRAGFLQPDWRKRFRRKISLSPRVGGLSCCVDLSSAPSTEICKDQSCHCCSRSAACYENHSTQPSVARRSGFLRIYAPGISRTSATTNESRLCLLAAGAQTRGSADIGGIEGKAP